MPLYHHKLNSEPSDDYIASGKTMPSGAVFYASLSGDTPNEAETGQTLTSNGTVTYQNLNGINCAKFSSSYISSTVSDLPTGNSSRSISFWYNKPSTGQNYEYLFYYGNYQSGAGDSCLCALQNNSYYEFSTWGGGWGTTSPSNTVVFNDWVNIVCIYDNNVYSIYKNGVLLAQKTGDSASTKSSDLCIAGRYDGWYLFSGYLSNFRVYDRALTQTEVTTLSQEFIPKIEYSSDGFDELGHPLEYDSAEEASCNVTRIPTRGLVFYVPLKTSADAAQTGQTLTSTGTVTYQTFNGIPCGYFSGSTDLHMSSYSSQIPIGQADRTISGWMYANQSGWAWICAWGAAGTAGTGGAEILGLTSSYYPVYSQNPDVADSTTNVQNTWIHIAGVLKDGIRYLYVNGVLKGSGQFQGSTPNSYGVYIGSTCGMEYFKGYISSVRIYSRALTQQELSILANEFTPTT